MPTPANAMADPSTSKTVAFIPFTKRMARSMVRRGAVQTMNATLLTYDSPMAVFSATKYTVPPRRPRRKKVPSSLHDRERTFRGEMVQMQR